MSTFTDNDPRHGTYAGVAQHHKRGIPACEPCLESQREYMRNRRLALTTNRPITFPYLAPPPDFPGIGATLAESLRWSA